MDTDSYVRLCNIYNASNLQISKEHDGKFADAISYNINALTFLFKFYYESQKSVKNLWF